MTKDTYRHIQPEPSEPTPALPLAQGPRRVRLGVTMTHIFTSSHPTRAIRADICFAFGTKSQRS